MFLQPFFEIIVEKQIKIMLLDHKKRCVMFVHRKHIEIVVASRLFFDECMTIYHDLSDQFQTDWDESDNILLSWHNHYESDGTISDWMTILSAKKLKRASREN